LSYFAVLEEIYNNVVPHWSAVLISCNHSVTRLISFIKTLQIRDQFFLYMNPDAILMSHSSVRWSTFESSKRRVEEGDRRSKNTTLLDLQNPS
jgi:hypothetical protein